MSDSVELRQGALRLQVFPGAGGSIGAFELQRGGHTIPLMRRCHPDAFAVGALAMASFPLVPYSNRILGGSFEFRGRSISQRPNMLPHEHPLHGHAWRAPWTVQHQTGSQLELAYVHRPDEWPWHYSALQSLRLSGTALMLTLSVENRSATPMPAGLGLHPYFECNESTTLRAHLPRVWQAKDFVPTALEPVARAWDFGRPQRVAEVELDHCFAGWDGAAEIHWPDRQLRLRIESDPVASHAVIYVPRGATFFCFEPVSHANDAFNLAARGVGDTGMRVIEPGERLSMSVRFSVDSEGS